MKFFLGSFFLFLGCFWSWKRRFVVIGLLSFFCGFCFFEIVGIYCSGFWSGILVVVFFFRIFLCIFGWIWSICLVGRVWGE